MRRLVTMLVAVLIVGGVLGAPAWAQEDGEAIQGTLRGAEREPVEGVTITVTQDGEQIGQATTGPEGGFAISVPGPGNYTVTLDPATLPEGVGLREEGANVLENVTVRRGQQRTVIFPLGEGAGAVTGTLKRAGQLLVEGIKFGLIIAMTAIGLSLIFGTTGLINFAHGELVTLGATFAFLFNVSGIGPTLHLVPAALIAISVGALIGMAIERGLWRPLRDRGTGLIQMFIISIGLSLLLRHFILILFGGRPRSYAQYNLQRVVAFGPVSITPRDLVVIGLSAVTLLAVGLMLQWSRIGKAMRAVADNRDLAESSGIDVERVVLAVWAVGGGLAALGGVFFGLVETITWDMGFNLLLLMFAGIILGGLGTAYGAVVGSLIVGIVAQVSTLYFPVQLQNAWALGVLIIVLLFRPQGLLGRPERVG